MAARNGVEVGPSDLFMPREITTCRSDCRKVTVSVVDDLGG
jgi:hypothetical protein